MYVINLLTTKQLQELSVLYVPSVQRKSVTYDPFEKAMGLFKKNKKPVGYLIPNAQPLKQQSVVFSSFLFEFGISS